MSHTFRIEEVKLELPTVVIKIVGRMDAKPAKEFRERCAEFRKEGFLHLVVDMSEVDFIASSGIGALVVVSGEFGIRNGSAHFVSLSQPVERVIQLLNVGQFLEISKNVDQALTKLPQTQ